MEQQPVPAGVDSPVPFNLASIDLTEAYFLIKSVRALGIAEVFFRRTHDHIVRALEGDQWFVYRKDTSQWSSRYSSIDIVAMVAFSMPKGVAGLFKDRSDKRWYEKRIDYPGVQALLSPITALFRDEERRRPRAGQLGVALPKGVPTPDTKLDLVKQFVSSCVVDERQQADSKLSCTQAELVAAFNSWATVNNQPEQKEAALRSPLTTVLGKGRSSHGRTVRAGVGLNHAAERRAAREQDQTAVPGSAEPAPAVALDATVQFVRDCVVDERKMDNSELSCTHTELVAAYNTWAMANGLEERPEPFLRSRLVAVLGKGRATNSRTIRYGVGLNAAVMDELRVRALGQ